MEVKIKRGNEILDATIEMIDGVMVVSPKELFEPENGDIVATEEGEHIFLCKDYIGEGDIYAYLGYDFNLCSWFKKGEWSVDRYATEEEKQKLFDKIKEGGYEWDAEKKELVKLKFIPNEGERFWFPLHYAGSIRFKPLSTLFNKGRDKECLHKGWCFKTEEECQAFCDRLNDAINSVKL